MKQNVLRGRAVFMIALIISLPIYSSFVFAALSNEHIYGTDRIEGNVRRDDTVFVNVTAKIIGDSAITPSQVHLVDLSGPSFHVCTDMGNEFFVCSYMMSSSSITQNPFQLNVVLYDDNHNFDSSKILYGAFDEIAPEIRAFNIIPALNKGENATLQYDVYDHSYSLSDANRCAGIKKIEFSSPDKGIFRNITFGLQPNDCSRTGSIMVPVNQIANTDSIIDVTLIAYDNFDQSSSRISQFTYDTQAPVIVPNSLEIKDINEEDINYIGNNPINGVIRFTVAAADLNLNNVYGDISEINIDNPSGYDNMQASCISIGIGEYRCSFTNIQVKLNQSTIAHIRVNASDLAGNVGSAVLTKNIIYDGAGPDVTSIRTDKVDDGISYAGNLNTFIVELNEDGIGIDKNDIRLDLSNIKTGLNNKAADDCSSSGSSWTCYWYNISSDAGDGEKTVYVKGDSSDKLGNLVSGTLSASVTVDRTNPAVISSAISHRGVGVEAIPGYIKTGDVLDVEINIIEKNKLRAYADFSSFVTTQDNISGSCSKEGEDNWRCEFSSAPIDVPGHIISNINFDLVDVVGNSIQHQEPIEVYWYENATGISYWTSSVKCSPDLVDRQITELTNVRVYCYIDLIPTTADQETLSINLGSCIDNRKGSLGFIETIQLLNAARGSTEPYLAVDLIKGEMRDKLSVICPLQIISRAGTRINKEPEIEPIKIDIDFYNMPLGEYGKGIEDKIKDAKEDAFGTIWKIIGFLKKLLRWARLACSVLRTIYKIKLIFQLHTEALTLAHITSSGTPLDPILGAAKTKACIGDKKMGEIAKVSYGFSDKSGGLDKFCKFINCQMSPPEPNDRKITEGKGSWGDIAKSIGRGHWFDGWVDENIARTGNWNILNWPLEVIRKVEKGEQKMASGTFKEVYGKQYYQYANARDNLLVAIVTGCIPGIINGLDKYRQIQCLYADCLEQNAYNNVPPEICEDQKSYATCKYIAGEISAVLPWTAFFDYYIGMIRSALSDPLTATLGLISSTFLKCKPSCEPTQAGSHRWIYTETWCNIVAFLSVAGEVYSDITGIIDDFKQKKADYCDRIKEEDEDEDED